MGLFTTLASTTTTGSTNAESGSQGTLSSAKIPTVVQLYSKQDMILMDETPSVSGYTSLTYQAVQVGATKDDSVELKNRHTNPDLGVWNCCVDENADPLVDSLLAKLQPPSMYCLTVDLSDETTVEPTLSRLQAALVRHLIEHPPPKTSDANQTTTLYDLQTAQFGLATEEKPAERSIEESAKDVKVGLMICAVFGAAKTIDESSETAFRKKQAKALLVYHLRKFANSIHAALCFVDRPKESSPDDKDPESGTNNETRNEETSLHENTQIAISYDKLSQLWRDMATGRAVWEEQPESTPTEGSSEASAFSIALYGPGRQQEDLIETLLLRNANYPGHWDASKDSLWVALPSTSDAQTSKNSDPSMTGDNGWLTQLRESIASALPPESNTKTDAKESSAEEGADKPKEKDAAVSSFFESLLKNP